MGDDIKERALERYEDAKNLANVGIWTVAMQVRRLRTEEIVDTDFPQRKWADFQFLIFALVRCRRAATLAMESPPIADAIRLAIEAFDQQIPNLKDIRDALEHIDDYAAGKGRNKSMAQGGAVFSAVMDLPIYKWLGYTIDIDNAFSAAKELFRQVKNAKNLFDL